MKLLISYRGYAGIERTAKGTPEELGLLLARVAQGKAKGRMTTSDVEYYAEKFADALRAEAEVPETRTIVFDAFAQPFEVGTNAGVSTRHSIPVTVLDVEDPPLTAGC